MWQNLMRTCVWMENVAHHVKQNKQKRIAHVSRDKTHNLTNPTISSVCWEWISTLTMQKSFLKENLVPFFFFFLDPTIKNILLAVRVSSCGYGSAKSVSGSQAEGFRSWQRVKVSGCVLCTVTAQISPCPVTRRERSECWAPGIMTGLRVCYLGIWGGKKPLRVRLTEISEIRWLDKNGPEVCTR